MKEHDLLQFFLWKHLPTHLQDAGELFCNVAEVLVKTFPDNPERTAALRKLLEAKDCAVRSLLYQHTEMKSVASDSEIEASARAAWQLTDRTGKWELVQDKESWRRIARLLHEEMARSVKADA